MQCANNMKQLGLALQSYHAAHGCFPPAGVAYGGCGQDLSHSPPYVGDKNVLNANGLMMLLPSLDQVPLYDAYDQKQCGCNVTVRRLWHTGRRCRCERQRQRSVDAVGGVGCPSDNGDPYLPAHLSDVSIAVNSDLQGAKTNYDFSANVGEFWCNYWPTAPASSRRMFGQNSTCRMADVRDGASNTIAMAERTYNVYNGAVPPGATAAM